MRTIIDRREFSDAFHRLQHDYDVTDRDALAAALATLEEQSCVFHGRLNQKDLAAILWNYRALMWSMVQGIETPGRAGGS